MKIILNLADGFEEIEAISVIDILRRADINIQTVSVTGKKEVCGGHDIIVVADEIFENAVYADADMIVLPGGLKGTLGMQNHKGLEQEILSAVNQNKWVAAICAAPTILGGLGLLEGKSATCYPGHEDKLTGAKLNTTDCTIIDGKLITSRGPGTAIDFALTIVEVLKGKAAADVLRKQMIIS